MNQQSTPYFSEHLQAQPEMLELAQRHSNLVIGVPRETSYQENRIALVPGAVAAIVASGHTVWVERNAGKTAHFPDSDFAEAGAILADTAEQIWQADMVVKVAPPSLSELELAKNRQTIISALHLTGQSDTYFKKLLDKKITALSFEHIRDKTNSLPIMRSLSEIVGSAAVLIGAEYLAHPDYGRGKMLGGFSGISPSEVVIIGAGNVGEFAARTALGLGALVKVFDNNIYKLRSLQNNLGYRVFTSILQPKVISNALRTADLAIGCLHALNGNSPMVIHEELVSQMKPGSVVVDVSIDQGGVFETSRITNHKDPVFTWNDITHYCVPNIASRVPHTASFALSNYFGPMLIKSGEAGGLYSLLKSDPGLRKGVYTLGGYCTNQYISDRYKLPFQDIDLLMTVIFG